MFSGSTTAATAALLLLLQGAAGPPVLGGERHILLTNSTREPVVEIHISEDRAGDWQPDALGADYLQPGQSVLVDIDDGNGNCRVDVKVILDDGSERISRGVNICREEGDQVSLR